MSAKMSQIVWNQAPYKADRLLVLLAMAEWADDEGICCVSYDRLADKARVHKQGAISIMQTLIADDAIRLLQKGGGRGKPSVYQLLPQNWKPKLQKKHRPTVRFRDEKGAIKLLKLIAGKVPKELPEEVREEMIQELAVAVLAGEFKLPELDTELDKAVTRFRRKVYRQSLTGFGYVSLDAVIPNTEGLTLGDTLVG
jgi:hypothetical protein